MSDKRPDPDVGTQIQSPTGSLTRQVELIVVEVISFDSSHDFSDLHMAPVSRPALLSRKIGYRKSRLDSSCLLELILEVVVDEPQRLCANGRVGSEAEDKQNKKAEKCVHDSLREPRGWQSWHR